jgi:rhamnulokinase
MDGFVAAVDLGASSGRVALGVVGPERLEIREVHRFANTHLERDSGLHWDYDRIEAEVIAGLRAATSAVPAEHVASVGIDAWAVDYALVDGAGQILEPPFHYRDTRSAVGISRVAAVVSREALYERTGLQFLPFTTIYQLAAARDSAAMASAERLLLIPDLVSYRLTGVARTELTNASTTGLLDLDRRDWATDLMTTIGIRPSLFQPIDSPGTHLGRLTDRMAASTGMSEAIVTLVGSHDTASAVVGVPAQDDRFAFISCGTWGLVGVEASRPIRGSASRDANFTNELGVDGTIRFLRNVMGLWLLQEALRTWEAEGTPPELEVLLSQAAALPDGGPQFDPDESEFLAPGNMPLRIADACARSGNAVPRTRPEVVRAILDSLAAAFGRSVRAAAALSGADVRVVHMVGGGARNGLLCQLTADACGVPVIAGPAEATTIGNILVQARAHSLIRGDLQRLRDLVAATQPLRAYEPRASGARAARLQA